MHRFNVIVIAVLAAGQVALWSQIPSHSADSAKISVNLVSFYEVPLHLTVHDSCGWRSSGMSGC